jgi:pimeloyl-ACP methyl ester carboxylesterase
MQTTMEDHMSRVTLNSGIINYERSGPSDGRPVVFVHGFMMGASVWRPLGERLSERGFLCFAPTWPLGAHTEPMSGEADLTMEGVAAIVGEFLDSLKLEDVVLVGNDTGGAVGQILATTADQRLGALVLTSCDAFEHFPPPIIKPLITAARARPSFLAALQPLRTQFGRRRGFGGLAHTDIDPLVREWLGAPLSDSRVRADLRRFTGSLNRQSTVQAGDRLTQFTKPALIAWSADDEFFPLDDANRLAAALPSSQLEVIPQAKTFSMIDQPDILTDLITDFAAAGAGPDARGGAHARPART